MAIRYSGDVEMRVRHEQGDFYIVAIRAPGERGQLQVRHRSLFRDAESSTTYDAVAKQALLKILENHPLPVEVDDRGYLVVRRGFQAPCPI